jgi:hypothetical protein
MNTDAEYHILSILREIQEALKQNGITTKKVVPPPVMQPIAAKPFVPSHPKIGTPVVMTPVRHGK